MKKHGMEGEVKGLDDPFMAIRHHPNVHRPRRHMAGESAGHRHTGAVGHVEHGAAHKQHNATNAGNRSQKLYSGS